jgi:gluconate 2-dehydrogenase gamma chain
MNRREALQRAAWLMGGALSAPLTLDVLDAYAAISPADWKPAVLSKQQAELVSVIADIMIPRTSTPGANDAGVTELIDTLLKNVYTPEDRERYLAGLAEFDKAAQTAYGKPFLALDAKRQSALVHKFHDEAAAAERRLEKSADDDDDTSVERPFILMTKELTMVGFFCSFPGATQVLQYDAIPGAYHGCLPLSEAGNGKTWAGEPGIRL